MSNKYSLGGYRIAVQAKTKKTILVEGKDDKALLNRFKLLWSKDNAFDIDSADILKGSEIAGLGNKAKIDFFLETIPVNGLLASKLRAFVDREWENLVDPVSGTPLPWSPPTHSRNRYLSLGHSIENYQFAIDCVLSYCGHFGGNFLTEPVRRLVQQTFSEILYFSAAFSASVRKRSAINRCSDALRLADVRWNGQRLMLDVGFTAILQQRGVENSETFISDVDDERSQIWSSAQFRSYAHLYSHGHLGEMIIWVSIAALAFSAGVSAAVCEEFAFGRREERQRFCQSWLTTVDASDIEPLPALFA